MRIVSMEKGDDIKAIITRFSNGTAQIQKVQDKKMLKMILRHKSLI